MHSVLGYLLFLHPQGKTSPLISVENIADKSIRLLVVQENIQKSMSTCMNPWSTVATIYRYWWQICLSREIRLILKLLK